MASQSRIACLFVLLSACGSTTEIAQTCRIVTTEGSTVLRCPDGSEVDIGSPPRGSLVRLGQPDRTKCPAGGVSIDVGRDDGSDGGQAGDGILQPGEVDQHADVCSGAPSDCSVEAEDGGVVIRCRDGTVVHFPGAVSSSDGGVRSDGGGRADGGALDGSLPDRIVLPDASQDSPDAASPVCGDDASGVLQDPVASAGFSHSCIVDACGRGACWGSGSFGESTVPSGSFRSISAGVRFTCAVSSTGAPACWGIGGVAGSCDDFDDNCGQALPPPDVFSFIGAGFHHACGLTLAGTLRCWGAGKPGDTGIWSGGQAAPPAGQFKALAVGEDANCALAQVGGAVSCWGAGAASGWSLPQGEFAQVAVHTDHGCVRSAAGAISCFGDDSYGQSTVPPGKYVQVATGGQFTCALLQSRKAICWGRGDDGRTAVPDASFSTIALGRGHGCGWLVGGGVRCWGANASGQASPPAQSQ